MRQMTTRGYDFLENEEGERLFAYDDDTGRRIMPGDPVVGVLTIGVGHTGPDVYPGQTITNEESRRLFDRDTDWAEAIVEKCMVGPNGEKPNDNQFNACGSLAFNIGKAGFAGSEVVRNWKAGDWQASGQAFKNWHRDKFGVNSVLVGRRARETSMFFEPMPNEVPPPMPQVVQPPKGVTASPTLKAAATVALPAAGVVIDNAQPALEAVQNAAATVAQATTAWGAVKDAMAPLSNGHVLTVILLSVSLIAIGYIALRVWRRIRSGEVSA